MLTIVFFLPYNLSTAMKLLFSWPGNKSVFSGWLSIVCSRHASVSPQLNESARRGGWKPTDKKTKFYQFVPVM